MVRPNGVPLYTFVNPVDDALMGITHVLRGEDILSSTPRQIALYLALIELGVTDFVPRFGHMPLVRGEGTKKLSKRDPESSLFHHRDRGFIPEGLMNYLALLGWSIAPDRDVFTRDEFIAAFDIADVNPNPASFDQKKADSINGDHIRMLQPDDFEARLLPYLAGVVSDPPTPAEQAILREAAPLVQERITVLSEARPMLEFFFQPDDTIVYEADALPERRGPGAARARRLIRRARAARRLLDRGHRADPAPLADRSARGGRRRAQAARSPSARCAPRSAASGSARRSSSRCRSSTRSRPWRGSSASARRCSRAHVVVAGA